MSANDVVSVVAGGWSMRDVDHSKIPGKIIAVNDSFVYLERRADMIISMDRLWTEHRWDQLSSGKRDTFIRSAALKKVDWTKALDQGWLTAFECNNSTGELSCFPGVLNGRNSGACAINLAYQLRPRNLFLFGFDMCLSPKGEAHWHPPYPWSKGVQGNTGKLSYEIWARDFDAYRDAFTALGTTVINVSFHSAILAFERISPRELGCGK